MNYKVNAIYATYQGEVNIQGIGAPVIFVRLQGCHLRCYLKTLGTLCDTPEGLEKDFPGAMNIELDYILNVLQEIRAKSGINLICLSGGDPLWRKQEEVFELLAAFSKAGFKTSVETSGTLSIKPYRNIPEVYWVLDYKLKSAGVPAPFKIDELSLLYNTDYIKFVVYDEEDYKEFKEVVYSKLITDAQIAIGPYWGGKITSKQLVQNLLNDELLGKVKINAQMHKLLTLADNSDVSKLEIPKLL